MEKGDRNETLSLTRGVGVVKFDVHTVSSNTMGSPKRVIGVLVWLLS